MISEMNDKFWMPYPLGRANTSFAPVYIVSCYTFPLFLSYNTLFLISLLYLSSKEKNHILSSKEKNHILSSK